MSSFNILSRLANVGNSLKGELSKGVPALVKEYGAPTLYGSLGLAALKSAVIDPNVQNIQMLQASREMLNKYPALKEEDPAAIRDYFNVVKTFSPKAATNPLVAGSIVNKIVQFGGVDHKLVQDLSSIEKAYTGNKENAMKEVMKTMVSNV